MKLFWIAATVCCCASAAPPSLMTYDREGRLLAQSEAVVRPGGTAWVSREALRGAVTAVVIDEEGRRHSVVRVTGDDMESGAAEVWIGLQAKPGAPEATRPSAQLSGAGHTSRAGQEEEAGAAVRLRHLQCSESHDMVSGPLFDEHGMLAGWHVSKTVDGRVFSFATGLDRLHAMSGTHRLTLAGWNWRHVPEREDAYLRALGHIWVKDFDGATFYLEKSIKIDPANARAWMELGFARGKQGRGEERLRCYRKAIAFDPALAPARYLLGVALLMRGDREGAEAQLKALKKIDQSFAERLAEMIEALHVDRLEHGAKNKVTHRHK